MDNGTIVEVLKYLDYCGLAQTSLVSKWFRDLIRIHRHKLALMCVDSISITTTNVVIPRSATTIFGQKLSPEAYNEWVVHNNNSEEVQIGGHVAGKQSRQNNDKAFQFSASAAYEELSYPWNDPISVFFARAVLNQENRHLFQHFVRLLTDPFIYIRALELMITQDDGLNLLIDAIDPCCSRLQCKKVKLNLDGNAQKSIGWIRGHVSCKELTICNDYRSKYDQELLDFFVTGAHCTSRIRIVYCVLSKVVVDLIQKFLDLKNCDEYQFVESIEGSAENGDDDVEALTERYAKFLVKKETETEYDYDYRFTLHVFEFVNSDIGKKLKLTLTKWSYTGNIQFALLFTEEIALEQRRCADLLDWPKSSQSQRTKLKGNREQRKSDRMAESQRL